MNWTSQNGHTDWRWNHSLCKDTPKVMQRRGISIIRWTKWSILQTLRTPITIFCLYGELMNKESIMPTMKVIHGLSHLDFSQPTWSVYYNSWGPKLPNNRSQYCVSFLVLHNSQLRESIIIIDSSCQYLHWNELYSEFADSNLVCL